MYDKSDLIKDTFIAALNKKISIYGSISSFNQKSRKKTFRELLKCYVDKDTTKNSLSFQLTNISGNISKLNGRANRNGNYSRATKLSNK